MLQEVRKTVSFIKKRVKIEPEVGIILGTGLGGLVKEIDIHHVLKYEEIPNFPVSTVEGHSGKLIFGFLGGKKVIAMQGRFHYYEGYPVGQVTFPVRMMKFLGIKYLFLSNASGGVNPDYKIGDLMIITDHINLISNPLIGKHNSEFGPRFPDMSEAYSKILIAKAETIAKKHKIKIQKGVYTATTGPTFETPSEYKYFRIIGSDTVGMSTTPEVIVARQMGLSCFAISIITDLGVPGKIVKVTHEEVQKVANKAELKMTLIIKELIADL
ncbi:MAG: purine-nucleoside phosphorylase [Bacteroidia bacterium]|nr:purine-nucleoside phosphorylase [Bacteroidia bacterium]